MTDMKGSTSADVDTHLLHEEWDEVSCPICMDHPHNAVLLLCSSHEKGCRSYICDTSYRHSNCLDRFKKLKVNHRESPQDGPHFFGNFESERHGQISPHSLTSESVSDGRRRRGNLTGTHEASNLEESPIGISTGISEAREETNGQEQDGYMVAQRHERIGQQQSDGRGNISEHDGILKCPLCRGIVLGYRLVKEARQYLDLKPRSCSWEACAFSGNYRELRRHARRVHPTMRPANADPSRQREWRHLEHDQEIGDVLSALRSTSPNAVVIGDYVIDGSNGILHDQENSSSGEGGRSWPTTFFLSHLNQLIGGPLGPIDVPRSSSRSWRTNQRSRHRYPWGANLLGLQDDDDDDNEFLGSNEVPVQRRTYRRSRHWNLWGENLLGLQDDDDDDEFLDGDEVPVPRRRRRFVRPRNDVESHER